MVIRKYGRVVRLVTVVFDGYINGPSTKDEEHRRRYCKDNKASPEVSFTGSQLAVVEQELFLANPINKNIFIQLLIIVLTAEGCTTIQASGDADTDIVAAAVRLATMDITEPVVVVADDTDILVLLVYHWCEGMADIYLLSQSRKPRGTSAYSQPISIPSVKKSIGFEACQQILTIHAIGWCDTLQRSLE